MEEMEKSNEEQGVVEEADTLSTYTAHEEAEQTTRGETPDDVTNQITTAPELNQEVHAEEEYDEFNELEKMMNTPQEQSTDDQEPTDPDSSDEEVSIVHEEFGGHDDHDVQALEGTTTEEESQSEDENSTLLQENEGDRITYLVRMSDEGIIMLDRSGEIPPDAPPHTYFPLTLPISQIKDLSNPLVGALPVPPPPPPRSRKTKPQAILYNDTEDLLCEMGPDGSTSQIEQPSTSPVPEIDLEFTNPDMMVNLESVLRHNQLEIREDDHTVINAITPTPNPSSSSNPATRNGSSTAAGGPTHHLWDHSYSNLIGSNSVNRNSSGGTVVQHGCSTGGRPKTIISLSGVPNPTPTKQTPTPNTPTTTTTDSALSTSSPQHTHKPVRMSQRQQDRYERLEAERILAENQQMLLKEKETMALLSSTTNKPITTQIDPSPPVTTVGKDYPLKPNTSTDKMSPSTTSTLTTSRPRRENRKLPAHLADPNYVNLVETDTGLGDNEENDDGEILVTQTLQISKGTQEIQSPGRKKSLDSNNGTESDEEEESNANNEDDPNKLWCVCRRPHNNRFMICCDRCEDWFHGKCVGITKAQGKVIEEAGRTWHCPNCRKEVKGTPADKIKPNTPSPKNNQQKRNRRTGSNANAERRASADLKGASPQVKGSAGSNATKAPAEQPQGSTVKGTSAKGSAATPSTTPAPAQGSSKAQSPIVPARGSRSPRKGQTRAKSPDITTPTKRPSSGQRSKPKEEPKPEVKGPSNGNCIVCKRREARPDSVYCGDSCVVQHSQSTSSQGVNTQVTSQVTPKGSSVQTATTATPKLKRSASKPEPDPPATFLTFHVISSSNPGSSASGSTAPQGSAKAQLSRQASAEKPPKDNLGQGPATRSEVPALLRRSTSRSSTKDAAPPSGEKPPVAPGHKRSASESSTPSTTVTVKTSRKEEPSKGPSKKPPTEVKGQRSSEKPGRGDPENDESARDRFRSSIIQTFTLRLEGMDPDEKALLPPTNTPDLIGQTLENELFKHCGGSTNLKYRNKCRSIVFNLRDVKNSLYKSVLSGHLSSEDVASFDSLQLASDELTQWRLQEQKKDLEIIQRAELEKLTELRKQELIDAGKELPLDVKDSVQSVVQEDFKELIQEDISGTTTGTAEKDDVISQKSSSKSKSGHSGHHSKHKHRHSTSSSTSSNTRSSSRHHSSSKSSNSDKTKTTSKTEQRSSHRSKSGHEDGSSKDSRRHTRSSSSKTYEHEQKQPSTSSASSSSRSSTRNKDSKPSSSDNSDKKDKSNKDTKSDTKSDSKSKSDPKSDSKSKTRSKSSSKHDDSSKNTKPIDDSSKFSKPIDDSSKNTKPIDDSSKNTKPIDDSSVNTKPVHDSSVNPVTTTSTTESPATTESPTTSSVDMISTNEPIATEPDSPNPSPSTTNQGEGQQDELDYELPSSTIKTPEDTYFPTSKPSTSTTSIYVEEKPVLRSKFVMPELGQFNASLYPVSHHRLTGTYFPLSPVPIVGRISPDTVWDYIDKMKKSKEVIIFRLAPATPADTEGYMSFFTYFSSRGRLGVLGGIHSPLKDVYLVPLDKHSPVNRVLLPFRGPGLPQERTHCLLAVVTRHEIPILTPILPPPPPTLTKRKLTPDPPNPDSSASAPLLKKRPKLLLADIKPGQISATLNPRGNKGQGSPSHHGGVSTRRSSSTRHEPKSSRPSTEQRDSPKAPPTLHDDATPMEEEEPYEPSWEEEDLQPKNSRDHPLGNKPQVPPPSGPSVVPEVPPHTAQLLLADLEAQIQTEKQAIQTMIASTLQRKTGSVVIPGLDVDNEDEDESTPSQVPFFLRQGQSQVPPAEVLTVPDDDAYSPSALQFSDDDELGGSNKGSGQVPPSKGSVTSGSGPPLVVSLDSDSDSEEPLPPGTDDKRTQGGFKPAFSQGPPSPFKPIPNPAQPPAPTFGGINITFNKKK